MSKKIAVDAEALLTLMDSMTDVFMRMDELVEAFNDFLNANTDGISVTFAEAEENNVIPIDKKKLNKQQSELYFKED
jgi:phenylpyruvate tautomerase PptA (4-oxalocrotonate tautomerase family)